MLTRIEKKCALKVCIAHSVVRRDQLVGASPFACNAVTVCHACFVFHSLVGDTDALGLEGLHDGVVGRDTMCILSGMECLDEYGICAKVVCHHVVFVTCE